MANVRLLLIEDNPRIQLANKDMLSLLGYEVFLAMNLAEARAAMDAAMPDALVLDIMLPDGSGLDFLAELRRVSDLPVLMLTALGTPEDTVQGLSSGADDYLAKPYDYKVLAARIEALLRRAGRVRKTLQKGALTFNILSGQVFFSGKDLLLTAKEFAVLLLLAQNEGETLSAEYIYETVWQQSMTNDSGALRSLIARLRGKLSGSGYAITSLRKEGYLFGQEQEL